MKKTGKMVQWALKTALNDKYGYSQLNREGKPDYDCSSFVSQALREGGFPVEGFPTTREMHDVLIRLGWHDINPNGKNGLLLLPGDIVLTPGKHVAIISHEGKMVHARSDENGGIRGDQPGDQTGHEIEESTYYGGWQYYMRYDEEPEYAHLTNAQYEHIAMLVMCGVWGEEQLAENNIDIEHVYEEIRACKESVNVIKGNYGVMPEREKLLEEMGFSYDRVQRYVNRRLGKLPW